MFDEKDIESIQQEWADGIIVLGQLKDSPDECRRVAVDFLARYYAFDTGKVLFKPTKAMRIPFRLTRKAALSYFIGGDPDSGEDEGFVLQPWTSIEFVNAGILIHEDAIFAMGHYTFMSADGLELLAEYSFGYHKSNDGLLRIQLHHSSLPYLGECG